MSRAADRARSTLAVLAVPTTAVLVAWALLALSDPVLAAFVVLQVAAAVALLAWLGSARRPRLLAAVSALLVALALAEGAALLHARWRTAADAVPTFNGEHRTFVRTGGPLGYHAPRDTRIRARLDRGSQAGYDVDYGFDGAGHRITPTDANAACGFVFIGGGWIMGEGLADVQTLPFFFARALGFRARVANLALPGFGPHQLLRAIEIGAVRSTGGPRLRAVFYGWDDDDPLRVTGRTADARLGPRYVLRADGVAHVGALHTLSGLTESTGDARRALAALARNSALGRLAPGFEAWYGEDASGHGETLARRLVERAHRSLRADAGVELVVLARNAGSSRSTRVLGALRDAGVAVVDAAGEVHGDTGAALSDLLARRYPACKR